MGVRTGVLELHHEEQTARIYFNQGALVHAELGELFGKDAFLDAARWRDGSFQFLNGTLPSYVSIQDRAMALIMEAAVYHDIWDQLHASAIYEDTYLQCQAVDEDQVERVFETPIHVEIWNRLGEPHTIREIVGDLIPAGYSKNDIVTGFWNLLQHRAIQPVARPSPAMEQPVARSTPVAPSLPVAATPSPVSPRHGSQMSVVIGGIVALLVVGGGLVWWMNRGGGDTARPANPAVAASTSPTAPPAPSAASLPPPSDPVLSSAPAPSEVRAPALPPDTLDALDSSMLVANEGNQVTVMGRIVRTNTDPKSGITFLDFRTRPREGFVLIIYPDDLGAWETLGAPLELYRNQQIAVRGRITLYNGLPQIALKAPEQIEILAE